MATLSQLGVPYLLDDSEESEAAAGGNTECGQAPPAVDRELHALLQRAAANATGGTAGADVSQYVAILKDEWIIDVEGLRRLEPGALDELLPLLLSQELQRLVRLSDEGRRPPHAQGFNRHGHWRRSTHRKRSDFGLGGGMDTIPEAVALGDEDASSSSSSAGRHYEQTYASKPAAAQTASHKKKATRDRTYINSTIQYAQNKKSQAFCRIFDLFDHFCSSNFKDYDEPNNNDILNAAASVEEEEGVDDDELQKISNSAPFTADRTERAYHLVADAGRKADIVTSAQRKFPTREALEDAIAECEARVQREKAAGATIAITAEDDLRGLYPLRLILPTAADLAEMISALQERRMAAMRNLDKKTVDGLGREIDALQRQVNVEERHCLRKRWEERECKACGEAFVPPKGKASRARERRCEKCREVFGSETQAPSVVQRVLTSVLKSAPVGAR